MVEELLSFGACDSGEWTQNWGGRTPTMEAMIGAREHATLAQRIAVTMR